MIGYVMIGTQEDLTATLKVQRWFRASRVAHLV